MKTLMNACPVCHDEVPTSPMGRPRTYCSVSCRREMESMRRELIQVEADIGNARKLAADDFWPGVRSWTAEAERLKLAAAELRLRTSEEPTR